MPSISRIFTSSLLILILIASCGRSQKSDLQDDSDIPLPANHIELDAKKPHLSNSKIDVQSYDVDLTFPSFAAGDVTAKDVVTLKLTTPSDDVRLHFNKNTMMVAAIKSGNQSLAFQVITGIAGSRGLTGDVLIIKLGRQKTAGTIIKLEISYIIKVTTQSSLGLMFRSNYEGSPIFETRNWPYYARFWLPSNDHPADTATFKVTLHVPPSAVGAANGKLLAGSLKEGEGTQSDGLRLFRWEQPTPIPTYGVNISVGELDVLTRDICFDHQSLTDRFSECATAAHKIPFVYYIQKNNKQRQNFLKASDAGSHSLVFFSSLLGLYPYSKLGYVTAPHAFNMESVSLIVMISPEATVHEVAHHWWGNTVYIGHWGDLWISEGFATYFTGLYDEFKTGKNTACTQAGGILNASPDTDPLAIFNNTPYCKGAGAIRDLRDRMAKLAGVSSKSLESKAIFYSLARKLYADFRFRRLTTPIFHQWLNQNIKPILAANGVEIDETAAAEMVMEWSVQWFQQPL